MKRITLCLLAAFALLALCSCQAGGDAGTPDDAPDTETVQSQPEPTEISEQSDAPQSGQQDKETPQVGEAEQERPETLQFQLGASGYAMSVPRSYRNGDVTVEELRGNQIAYYYSAESDMDFDVYQFPKPDSESGLEEYLHAAAADFDGTEIAYRQINGVNVGSYKSREIYDGVEYDVLVALMEEGAEYVQVIFWLDGENAEQEAMDILNTIAPIETRELQLGKSPFRLVIPVDYQPGEVTAEQAADDMIGYYYNETTPLDFDVYEFGKNGFTLEKYAIEEAKRYEAERVDYRTINGIDMAVYYSYEEYEGQTYRVCNYLFEYGDDFVEVAFWLDGEIAVKQADRIISTLTREDA